MNNTLDTLKTGLGVSRAIELSRASLSISTDKHVKSIHLGAFHVFSYEERVLRDQPYGDLSLAEQVERVHLASAAKLVCDVSRAVARERIIRSPQSGHRELRSSLNYFNVSPKRMERAAAARNRRVD